jgi:transcriptional regulator GlxA family with amidase domain
MTYNSFWRILDTPNPSPGLERAQHHARNLIDFVEWFTTLDPTEGIHVLADELGMDVNQLKEHFSKAVRQEVARIDPAYE